ncbi:MAG TPA: hypothetical protein VEQ85_08525 [Lacipirellulaceae bacterium]|nr:hypothetical protein [Lacipirellulaceae bacterium]
MPIIRAKFSLATTPVLAARLRVGGAAPAARACPFCNAAMQTLSQEIEAADVAAICVLEEPMPMAALDDPNASEAAAAKFRIVEVLRGQERLEGAKTIDVVYFGDEAPDKQFMITGLAGVTGPGLDWTTPVPLSPRAVTYIKKLPTIPAAGADRLAFFQDHLEDEDPLLAQDAYDEFARTPYADVIALAPRMQRERILGWINDATVGPSSRRLYLTMLGICGKPEDVAMLEQLMNFDYLTMQGAIAAAVGSSTLMGPTVGVGLLDEVLHAEERRKRESLDALIACYLKLRGPEGLELINRLFLGNPQVEYKHLHSAIMALRFHGEETDVIPRERLLDSMRLALDHHDFADQVIPDLTRWEDWAVMPRLIAMFKESKPDDWVRQPVVSYLLVAADQPGDVGAQAQAAVAEFEKLDPETVKRARSLSAFGFLARAASQTTDPAIPAVAKVGAATTDAPPPATGGQGAAAADGGSTAPQSAAETSDPAAAEATDEAQPPADNSAVADPLPPGVPRGAGASADQTAGLQPKPPVAAQFSPPSKTKIIGIPLLAAVELLGVFAILLRGADPRSSSDS